MDEAIARGQCISALRSARGFSQRRLAEISGVNQSTISRLEGGDTDAPDEETLGRLLVALEISPEHFDRFIQRAMDLEHANTDASSAEPQTEGRKVARVQRRNRGPDFLIRAGDHIIAIDAKITRWDGEPVADREQAYRVLGMLGLLLEEGLGHWQQDWALSVRPQIVPAADSVMVEAVEELLGEAAAQAAQRTSPNASASRGLDGPAAETPAPRRSRRG